MLLMLLLLPVTLLSLLLLLLPRWPGVVQDAEGRGAPNRPDHTVVQLAPQQPLGEIHAGHVHGARQVQRSLRLSVSWLIPAGGGGVMWSFSCPPTISKRRGMQHPWPM